jgi:hypothetical protein
LNIRSIFTTSYTTNSVKRMGKLSPQNVQVLLFSNAPFFSIVPVDFRTNFLIKQFKKSLPEMGVAFFSEFMRPFKLLKNAFHEWLIHLYRLSNKILDIKYLGLS